MTEYRVVIPQEIHTVLTFEQAELPGFATVNSALKGFEPKTVFGWHLSVLVVCDDLVENKLPSPQQQEILYRFEDRLDALIEAEGNAVFLARVTHDARRELIWRVYDPEPASGILQQIIASKYYSLEFDYRMEHDPQWKLASWYLDNLPG